MRFKIEIRETFSRTVEVDANDLVEAMNEVKHQYRNEKIVLGTKDYKGVEYIPQKE